jgi:ABC-type bacteriocin/lantibiotic exporter with double-glycine peptidase domain
MVLAFHGDPRGEAEIRQLLGATAEGTELSQLLRLTAWGYEVLVEHSSLAELEDWLLESLPPIVGVDASLLPYWTVGEAFHAVVVVGLDRQNVTLHDPLFESGPQVIARADFRDAWSAARFRLAIVRPTLA